MNMTATYDKQSIEDSCREIVIELSSTNPLSEIEKRNERLFMKLSRSMYMIYTAQCFIADNIPILLEDMECDCQDYENILYEVAEVTLDYIGKTIKYHNDKNSRDKRLGKIPNNGRSESERESLMIGNAERLLTSLGMSPKGGLALADGTLVNVLGISEEAFTLSKSLYDLIKNPSKYTYVDYANKDTSNFSLQKPKQITLKKELMNCLTNTIIRDKENRVDSFIQEVKEFLNPDT